MLIEFLSDRRILVGIGIGLILSALIMTTVKLNVSLSKVEIEKKARGYGMEYPTEFKVINKDVGK